ncbi:MAG: methyltransferase domain-containing protein [Acidobacteriaceae bacterium]
MTAPTDPARSTGSQTWNPCEYSAHGRFVTDLGANILEWLDPQPSEEILDLGCGDGVLTAQIAERGAHVLGVDASPEMVDAARIRGIAAEVINATQLTFQRQFDAVFSNAALHWVHDQPALLRGVAHALKPGGRFVAEMGGHGNIAAIRVALHAALSHHGLAELMVEDNYFPTVAEYRGLLESHGFAIDAIELVPRPTPLPTGMRAWLIMFRRGLFDRVPENLRDTILNEALDHLAPALCDKNGNWTADYVRLKFRAHLISAGTV